MNKLRWGVAARAALTLTLSAAPAHAGVAIGIGFGGPGYYRPYGYRPYWGYGGYGYYRPYGVGLYIAPPPVVIAPAPVVVGQPPVIVQQAPVGVQSVPVQAPAPIPAPQPAAAPTTTAVSGAPAATVAVPAPPRLEPVSTVQPVATTHASGVDRALKSLTSSDEHARADAAVELGRLRAETALDRLAGLLANDPSAQVREAAARGLGLLGSPRGLNALRYAGQADNDRDVRRSAQFAVDVITTNMRR